MEKTPNSLRLHIALFGRTNTGKSSFLNYITGQDVAITSSLAGTTTDVVEKSMELLPLGPVLFLDTAGFDDRSELAGERLKKTNDVFNRTDIILLITEPEVWTEYEENIIDQAKSRNIPYIIIINKIDLGEIDETFLARIKTFSDKIILASTYDQVNRDRVINLLKEYLIEIAPDNILSSPLLISDLVRAGGLAVLIVPIDLEAPKGRLILPQVQTIRDALDNDAAVMIVKEREYASALANLRSAPEIVVCDSQIVLKMTADTPREIKCTTFSILFSRLKGDLIEMARGAAYITKLKKNDRVLIAEACSHHALEDDIGRVKIPRWLKQYCGNNIGIDVVSGKDYPDHLEQYKLIIHCGGCMINRRLMLSRIQKAKEHHVPITNYGTAISLLQGVLERVLEPFPAALDAFQRTIKEI